ncbi:hypothetical protein L6452_21870 [Arctium lappa]|uniref:Uncharacterized protein n=1 Tax=Arctium lappa TaxID=4217 RepID=A0ACB9AYZ0_ARCLA|nr:hypothetical protein L6452_21870 [Arctium lappa]
MEVIGIVWCSKKKLIDPAVKGALNVLSSCSKVPSIKRVVLTSSVAAVLYNGSPLTPEDVVDESWFSNQGICKETKRKCDGILMVGANCRH